MLTGLNAGKTLFFMQNAPKPPRFKVIYMEDDPVLARLVQLSLARLQYEVDVVTNGVAGLKCCNERHYDIVLVDNQMPKMTGLEVIRRLAMWESSPPVIMITGAGDESLAVQAIKAGASDYLTKDDSNLFIFALPNVIRKAIEAHQLKQERRAYEQAKDMLIEELQAYSQTVAHDLKNPLSSIEALIELIQTGDIGQEEQTRFLATIGQKAQKMRHMVRDLLKLAQSQDSRVETQKVDMQAVLQEALGTLHPMIERAQAVIEIAGPLPQAIGQKEWLEEVWGNLLSNAIKYSGPKPLIQVKAGAGTRDRIRFSVKDHGQGLPPQASETIFQPFTRLNHRQEPEGHGLGLSIVKRFVERMGGEVGVKSEWGKGAEFYFELPAVTTQAESRDLSSSPAAAKAQQSSAVA
jgi:signal transduction histidine kinase